MPITFSRFRSGKRAYFADGSDGRVYAVEHDRYDCGLLAGGLKSATKTHVAYEPLYHEWGPGGVRWLRQLTEVITGTEVRS